jgi:Flp pilus assembly protein TadD
MAAAWNNLGIALEEQGRAADGEAAYRQALAADPGELRALFNLGQLQRKAGRFAEAAATQERLLATAPAHAGAHFELGALYAGPLGRPDEGRAHLRRAIELEPGHPRAAQARAILERLP